MSDVFTAEQRSKLMSRVRSRDTGLELRLRKALWKRGLRYRLRSTLPGKPDLVFPSSRVAVFVDGCFWHRCPIHGTLPKTNKKFWLAKLNSNVKRDAEVKRQLQAMGWYVVRIWQHDLRDLERVVNRIENVVRRRRTPTRQRPPGG